MRVDVGKLGSQKENQGGIVHPDQDDHRGRYGAVHRRHGYLANIEPDRPFPEREEHGGGHRSDPDVPPGYMPLRQYFEYEREEQSEHDWRSREIHDSQDNLKPGHRPLDDCPQCRKKDAQDQGGEEKKACAEHEHKRYQLCSECPPENGTTLCRDPPNED